MKTAIRRLIFVALFLMGFPVLAQPITEVTWETPAWEGLTKEDDTGLYHELISAIYGNAGIKVVINYRPWARAVFDVENGTADFTGGDSRSNKFAQPNNPIIRHTEVVFFRKTAIPSYQGVDDLRNKKGVWIMGYTDNFPHQFKKHLKGNGNPSRNGALKMVLLGRADYYLDNDYQLPQTLKEFEGLYTASEYDTGTVYVEDLFMCFTKSPRGQRLADIFDQGMKKLAESGELKKIYAKWKRIAPPVK